MSKDNSRRDFLAKIALGLSAASIPAIADNNLNNSNKESKDMNPTGIIKQKPLGFQWETADPFLFCVHHEDFFPKGNGNMAPEPIHLNGRNIGSDFVVKDGWRMYHGKSIPGFPAHPHRGFETITIVRQGLVDHADSLGAAGRYGGGDVQWMTAGSGLNHSEMFPLLKDDAENTMELFQIWINLPRAKKMVQPSFKMLWRESIPTVNISDENSKTTSVTVIAGELNGHRPPTPPPDSWAVDENNGVTIYNIRLDAGAKWTIPASKLEYNRTLYFFKGSKLTANGENVNPYHAIEVLADREMTLQNGDEESFVLMLQGRPINEPVVQHGPFVMNTRQEIQQAFVDYQQTQFGGWPWENPDTVHDKSKGRFAKHFDGTLEEKA